MRVIAGELRSRRLKAPRGLDVRPTPDRLREALFNVLASRISECLFLDAYAGSGAVGIEALSRGARRAVFAEKNRIAVMVLRENLASLGLLGRAEVCAGKAIAVLERVQADIVFLDPPYDLEREYEGALAVLGAAPPPLVIVQHAVRNPLLDEYGRLRRRRMLRQGDNALSFFEPEKSAAADPDTPAPESPRQSPPDD
jgi:16S rRNA (guanine(966)-N(2))-methyltransferase RsmD